MSTYENYTQVSRVYDETRWAVGLDLITEGLSSTCTAIEQQVLLDAGCGTGIYTAALIDRVSRIEAVDLNPAMLCVAQSKLVSSSDRDRVRFWQASISELPLDDNSVDSIVINQVLHHLSDRVENDWPAHRKVLAECTRVLKPHGVMIINSCAHVQLDRGFWFYRLIPAALAAVKQRTIPLDDLERLMHASGLDPVNRRVDLEGVLQGAAYFRADGPLDPLWRQGDSIWSLVSEPDLKTVLDRITSLMSVGDLDAFMKHSDTERLKVGQITFSVAHKT